MVDEEFTSLTFPSFLDDVSGGDKNEVASLRTQNERDLLMGTAQGY